jgi:hypothetical protein
MPKSQRLLIKGLVAGLPLGLFVSIGIALALYVNEPGRLGQRENEKSISARPIAQADLERTIRVLTEDVGPRSLVKEPEAAERARKFVQSTLGPDNIGYFTEAKGRQIDEAYAPAVFAELPGRGRAGELVVIVAAYTSQPGSADYGAASGCAALLSIAKAMAGSEHQRTIRFVGYAAGAGPAWQRNLSQVVRSGKEQASVVLDLDVLTVPARISGIWEADVPLTLRTRNHALGVDVATRFARGTGLRIKIIEAIDEAPAWSPQMTVTSDDHPKSGEFGDWDYPRFTQTAIKLQKLVERLANPGHLID